MAARTSPESRKYFIAAMVLIGIAVLIVGGIGGWLAFTLISVTGPISQDQLGIARLTIPGPLRGRYGVEATLDVPPSRQFVHSEPSLQFALRVGNTIRLEAGLIRSERNHGALGGFLDTHRAGQRAQIVYLEPIPSGPHRVSLDVDGADVTLRIDGVAIYNTHEPDLATTTITSITVGTAVGLQGEIGEGHIDALAVRRGDYLVGVRSACTFTTYGLALTHAGVGWTLSGRNESKHGKPTTNC